jgi:Xaa-Pro dipeptidase
MTHSRLDRIISILNESELDALVLNPGASLYYLSGFHFHLMERPIVLFLPRSGTPALVLPALEMLKVQDMPIRVEPFPYGDNPATWQDSFRKALDFLGLKKCRIGIEPTCLRALELNYLHSALPDASFPDASPLLSEWRICKEVEEISSIRRAVEIAETALTATLPLIHVGVTEKEISTELSLQLIRAGSELNMAFQPIVSGGPNSANPHAEPSERNLVYGDLLVIDWGAVYNGYISDLTRTFAIGNLDPEFNRIAAVTAEANSAGRAACRPGIPAGEVDLVTRKVIDASGYGEYFTHRTGHGIGLEGHEPPYIYGENSLVLKPGMVFTIEPGIYLPGRNGVRIEDNIVITSNGAETLSSLPRELHTLE